MDVFARTNEGGLLGSPRDDVSTSGGSSSHCAKCGCGTRTNHHSRGNEYCPWNTMSASAARKNENKFMTAMASGSPATLAPEV